MDVRRLRIAEPCGEDVSRMRREGGQWHCDRCRKSVTDLSSMTRAQARRFLQRATGPVCIRVRIDRDGVVQYRPTTTTIAIAALALSACAGYAEPDTLESPTDAVTCEDASGYTIACDDDPGRRPAPPSIPDAPRDVAPDRTRPPMTPDEVLGGDPDVGYGEVLGAFDPVDDQEAADVLPAPNGVTSPRRRPVR